MASGTYKNEAIQEYVNEFLTTYVDLEGLCTTDNSLVGQDGDTVKIYQYTLSGNAEDVAEGYDNTGVIDIGGTYESYTIQMAQAKTSATDEAVYRNPLLVEEKIKGCAKAIFNKEVAEIAAEWNKCSKVILEKDTSNSLDMFDQLMAAQGLISTNVDGTAFGMQWLVSTPDYFRRLKKDLKGNVLVEYDMINGKKYPVVGGIPIKVSDGVKSIVKHVEFAKDDVIYTADGTFPASPVEGTNWSRTATETLDTACTLTADNAKALTTAESYKESYKVGAFLIDSTAVKVFRGKSVSAESAREAGIRTTYYWARDNYVTAIEFKDRAVALGLLQA